MPFTCTCSKTVTGRPREAQVQRSTFVPSSPREGSEGTKTPKKPSTRHSEAPVVDLTQNSDPSPTSDQSQKAAEVAQDSKQIPDQEAEVMLRYEDEPAENEAELDEFIPNSKVAGVKMSIHGRPARNPSSFRNRRPTASNPLQMTTSTRRKIENASNRKKAARREQKWIRNRKRTL